MIHRSAIGKFPRPRGLARAVTLACALVLAGCGTNPGDRVLSGSMLGAAGGAIIGAATGSAATGAAIGAVSGAFIGGATNPCDLNFGTPYWRRHGGRQAYDRRCRGRHYDEPPG